MGNNVFVRLLILVLFTCSTSIGLAAAKDRADCIRTASGGAVVYITYSFETKAGDKDSVQGSGFLVKSDGHIVTAAHVLRPPEIYKSDVLKSAIKVRVGNFFATEFTATVITQQVDLDVALIKIPSMQPAWPVVQVSFLPDEASRSWLYALGFPGQVDLTGAGPGKITAANAVIAGAPKDWWQTDLPLNPGMSGGPVFNDFGDVAGLAGALKTTSGGSISYVIPIRHAASLVPLLGLSEYVPSPCADDPSEKVLQFVDQAMDGKLNKDTLSVSLWHVIQTQTNNTGRYKQFEVLGPKSKLEIVERKEIPQGTWFTIKVTHQKGVSLWVVGWNRGTGKIESSAVTPQMDPAFDVADCQTVVRKSIMFGNVMTSDERGSKAGELSDLSATVIQECASTKATPTYRLHISYRFNNGSYSKGGTQNLFVQLKSAEGANVKTVASPINRSKCVYGNGETRSDDFVLDGGLVGLIGVIEIEPGRVEGSSTPC